MSPTAQSPGAVDTFRFTPQVAWIVDNNLLVGNMDFAEFAEHVDQDGVYRG